MQGFAIWEIFPNNTVFFLKKVNSWTPIVQGSNYPDPKNHSDGSDGSGEYGQSGDFDESANSGDIVCDFIFNLSLNES